MMDTKQGNIDPILAYNYIRRSFSHNLEVGGIEKGRNQQG